MSRQFLRNYRLNDSAVRFMLWNRLHAKHCLALVLRVLYRFRSLSEQAPFDVATFSYASPLLAQVLLKGGIDVGEDSGDEVFEQVTLALDIIKFHCSECLSLLQVLIGSNILPCSFGCDVSPQGNYGTCLARHQTPAAT